MVQEFLMTTYTISLPIILGWIVWLLKQQKKTRDANSEGTLALLRDKLMFYHEKYIERGAIPIYAFENWEKMFKAYVALGGNGMVVQLDKEVRQLPIEERR